MFVGSWRQKSALFRRQKSVWAWAAKECLAKGGKDNLLSNAAKVREGTELQPIWTRSSRSYIILALAFKSFIDSLLKDS